MKKITTAAILVGGAIMASQSGFGQAIPNDLYLGFQNQAGGGTEDYIINLGSASSIVGGSSVVDLSAAFTLGDFNAVLGTSSSMFGGVVGGSNAGNPSDIYLTQLRSGGAGNPSVAGSSVTKTASVFLDNNAFTSLGTLVSPDAGTGVLDTSKSWENVVEPTFTTGSFYGTSGLNPDSPVSGSGVLYEDLWTTSSSGSAKPFTYLGYFTLDPTAVGSPADPTLTFTPVPEPATTALIGGGSLLLLALRRRSLGKNA
jgi:hypothetical protein